MQGERMRQKKYNPILAWLLTMTALFSLQEDLLWIGFWWNVILLLVVTEDISLMLQLLKEMSSGKQKCR